MIFIALFLISSVAANHIWTESEVLNSFTISNYNLDDRRKEFGVDYTGKRGQGKGSD